MHKQIKAIAWHYVLVTLFIVNCSETVRPVKQTRAFTLKQLV